MNNLRYAAIFMAFVLPLHAYSADGKPKNMTLKVNDNSSCIAISENSFFLLSKGTVTISYLKREPKLVTVSYLSSSDYHPIANRVDLLTIREQSQDLASTYFKKASAGLEKVAQKDVESQIVKIDEKDISCGVTGKAPGLAAAKTVLCYLKTENGTHTFSAPVAGDIHSQIRQVYSNTFSRSPCANVIQLSGSFFKQDSWKKY